MSLPLTSPVMVAAGCGGTGRELAAFTDLSGLGGFVTRSITLAPRSGGTHPRILETPSGLVHAVDLQNPGVDQFLALELPWLVRQGAQVFVSMVGRSLGEYAELGASARPGARSRRDRGQSLRTRCQRQRRLRRARGRSTPRR